MKDQLDNGLGLEFIKRIKRRLLYQNKNWLAIICGETGSGKSYSAISLASKIGRVHIVFTPVQFLKLINSNSLSKGDVIVFDEAGVGMSSREWYSVQNKLLGSVLQTFRILNCGVIFTTPNLSFIDVQARKLFHNYMETSYLDFDKEEAYLKVYDIDVNSRYDKVYFKMPRFYDGDRRIKMEYLVMDKPKPNLIEYYENRKKSYTIQLNKKALEELTGTKESKKKKEVDLKAISKKVIKNKSRFVKEYNQRKYVDPELLRHEFNLTKPQAKYVKVEAENKLFNKTHNRLKK